MTLHSLKLFLGTLFGAGYISNAPGTLGSLLFLPFIYATEFLFGLPGLIVLTLISSILSLWTAPAAMAELGDDPGQFIMDECAGQTLVFAILALFNIPMNLIYLFLGFLFFRLFDITKPLGIKRVETFRGKFGILWDDLVAGIYAALGLTALITILSVLLLD
ncbi:MAG: phosphatidylglycerophosphatase A [Balneolaceae bacterium]